MPELPEVETIVRSLAPALEGRVIADVAVEWPGTLGGVPIDEFRRAVVGHRFERLTRRGKFVVAYLSGGLTLTIHLRMSGQLLLRPAGSPPDRFVRAIFFFDDGNELRFADMRKFGRVRALDTAGVRALDESLGPEPLGEEFTVAQFAAMLRGRRTKIKPLLLDQRFIAGIGNIYADEALHMAGIHPLRAASSLTPPEVERLYEAIRRVLRESIGNRGTTFSSYMDGFGQQGGHQYALRVYHRHGSPCQKCATVVERMSLAGRGTHFCPRCQPPPEPDSANERQSRGQ